MLDPNSLTVGGVFWWADQSAGWIYLLPPLERRHVLCLDPPLEIAWLMSRTCRCVTIAYTSKDAATFSGMEHANLALENTTWIPFDRMLEAAEDAPVAQARFDGLLIHDPQARVINARGIGNIERLTDALPRLLSKDSFVYLGMRRRWSLFDLPGHKRLRIKPHPLSSFRRIANRLRRSGFDQVRRYPMLLSGSRVVDILNAGYRASTNGALWRERLKEFLLGPSGARILAPAHAWVATTPGTESTVLDDVTALVGRVVRAEVTELRVTQYRLARGDKAILGFEHASRPEAATIAVVSEDPNVIRGRRIESEILEQISRLPDGLSRMAPRHLGEFQIGRYTCFLITSLPGVTLDMAADTLRSLTDQALAFLKALQVYTAVPTCLDAAALDRHVGSILRDAIARNPELEESLVNLRETLVGALQNRTIPTVFTHGDYKIENVMYSRVDGVITGIIDWEHALPAALPLLDVLYLLFYNRILRGSQFIDVLECIVDRARLEDSENMLIDDYLAAIGMPGWLYLPLAALFLAHHIGRRITLERNSEVSSSLRRILLDLSMRISALEPTASVPRSA